MRKPGITQGIPADCTLISAADIRKGDEVRFRAAFANYVVEETETDSIGHVRHRAESGSRTCSYHPGELLWITKRANLVQEGY